MDKQHENPLGVEPINHLMARFAIPSIIAMLVSALYNMVDQFFIGHSVGMQGNAATNVAFPLTITCTAVSLLFGIGGAANFNLSMGRKSPRRQSTLSEMPFSSCSLSGSLSAFWSSFFWTRF